MIRLDTGEFVTPPDCKSWSCPIHGSMQYWRWWLRTRDTQDWATMLNVTLVPTDLKAARVLWRELRRWMPKGTRYVRTLELGEKTGMVHWHAITTVPVPPGLAILPWGKMTPAQKQGWKDYSDTTTAISQAWGGGYTTLRPIYSGLHAAAYCLKYLTKNANMKLPDGHRRIVCARGIPNWETVNAARHPEAVLVDKPPMGFMRLDGLPRLRGLVMR